MTTEKSNFMPVKDRYIRRIFLQLKSILLLYRIINIVSASTLHLPIERLELFIVYFFKENLTFMIKLYRAAELLRICL